MFVPEVDRIVQVDFQTIFTPLLFVKFSHSGKIETLLTLEKDDLEEQSADPITDRFRNTVFLATRRKQSYFSHCLKERYML